MAGFPRMKTVALLNGPNLNRLGTREPEIYGTQTLHDLVAEVRLKAEELGLGLDPFQSNHEGEMIEKIHAWTDEGLRIGIINPAALTHTSVALRDALSSTPMRFVEVHLSHIHARETFRHTSLTAPACIAQISGMGSYGYLAALEYLARLEA